MNNTKIMFKGDKLGIKVIIDKDLSFDEVKNELSTRANSVKAMFGNASCAVTFMGKELSDEETKILVNILARECELEVTFTVDETYLKKYLKTETMAISKDLPELPQLQTRIDKVLSEKENNTLFHKGSLRSGASIKHNGSIVIIGDVNAGAEIIAEGNVIVLGNAKGLIQAGCAGNKKCFVFALNLLPIQLRIGEIIAFLPKEEKRAKGVVKPQVAYVDDDKIFISEV